MRIFIIVCSLLVSGCATLTPRDTPLPDTPAPSEFSLSARDAGLAQAAARYMAGLVYEGEEGRGSSSALAEFREAVKLDPGRLHLYSKIAELAMFQNRPEEAIGALDALCAADPTNVQARVELAAAHLMAGSVENAEKMFRRAIDMAPERTAGHWELARLLFATDRDDEAIEVLRTGLAAADAPLLLVALTNVVGAEFVRVRALPRALAVYEFLAREAPVQQREFTNLLGDLYEAMGRTGDAADAYERGTLLPDPLPASFLKLGILRLRADEEDRAIDTLQAAHKLFPVDRPIAYLLAYVHIKKGRHAEAIPIFEALWHAKEETKSPPTPPMSEDFYTLFAHACEKTGDSARAASLMEDCIRLYPRAHEALNYLAYTWAERGERLDEALDYVTRALAEEPDNGAYVDTLGWVFYKLGRFEEARVQIERALELIGEDAVVADHLGDVYDALKNVDQALRYWRISNSIEASEDVRRKIENRTGAAEPPPAKESPEPAVK